LNSACDKLAKQTAKGFLADPRQYVPPLLLPPYPGRKAMLRIGDTWITSKYDYHIHLAARTPMLKAYCLDRHGWTPEVFESIHWDCIGTVRSAVKCITKTDARVSKLMHGWLPIMHILGKFKETLQCPGCEWNDETFVHLYQCTHKLM
jgi:hypothetical protein